VYVVPLEPSVSVAESIVSTMVADAVGHMSGVSSVTVMSPDPSFPGSVHDRGVASSSGVRTTITLPVLTPLAVITTFAMLLCVVVIVVGIVSLVVLLPVHIQVPMNGSTADPPLLLVLLPPLLLLEPLLPLPPLPPLLLPLPPPPPPEDELQATANQGTSTRQHHAGRSKSMQDLPSPYCARATSRSTTSR
jgi:hypothetical protein